MEHIAVYRNKSSLVIEHPVALSTGDGRWAVYADSSASHITVII